MANQRHDVAFVVGAVVGSVAGAVYGLFNAPQAGWRTRADLSGSAEELGDRVAHRIAAVAAEARLLLGIEDAASMSPAFAYDAAPVAAMEPPRSATEPVIIVEGASEL